MARIFIGLLLTIASLNTYAVSNYWRMIIANQTQIGTDENVYFIIKAMDIANGKDCLIKVDKESGLSTCIDVNTNTVVSNYAYKLSDLPKDGDNRFILLPQVESGRIYFSVGYPMDLYLETRSMKITDPDGFKPRDSNYYTLYDKIEFTYDQSGTWINPTAVDFFSLPIRIEEPDSSQTFKSSGLYFSRQTILNNIQTLFSQSDTTTSKIWNKLFLYYKDENGTTVLRFVSPAKAMLQIPGTVPFDSNYLSNNALYGFDYVAFLWTYYGNHSLLVDCSEIKSQFALDNYLFSGHIVNNKFVFTNQTNSYQISIDKPQTSMPFFGGAGESFDAQNNTPKAVIVRQLTSAFEVGLLPAANATLIDKNYFVSNKNKYYQSNSLLPKTTQGPWYDLYSKSLHQFGNEQPIYTFAYDDALSQDGTLHDFNANSPASVTITLGNLSGTHIPNPYVDKTLYTVTPIIGYGTEVIYNGQLLQSNKSITNVKIPFKVKLNGQDATIYFKYPLVKPHFSAADGIVINKKSDSAVEVIFPAK